MLPLPGRRGHPTIEELSEHLDGRLEGGRRERIDSHLAGCDACRRSFEELRATVLAVRTAPQPSPRRSYVFTAPPSPSASPDKAYAAPRGRSGGIGPAWALPVAAAAVFVLFLGALGVDFSGLAVQTRPAPLPQASSAPERDRRDGLGASEAAATPTAAALAVAGDTDGTKRSTLGATITGDESANQGAQPPATMRLTPDTTPTPQPVSDSTAVAPTPGASFAPAAAMPMPTGTSPPPTATAPAPSATENGTTLTLGPQPTPSPALRVPDAYDASTPTPAAKYDGGEGAPLLQTLASDSSLTSRESYAEATKPEPVESKSITPSWLRAVEMALGGMSALLAAAALYAWRRG